MKTIVKNKLNTYNWDIEEIVNVILSNAHIVDCDETYVYIVIDNIEYKIDVEGNMTKI